MNRAIFLKGTALLAVVVLAACSSGGGGGGGGSGQHSLAVIVSGSGTVASTPAGITGCTANTGTCTANFGSSTSVLLAATPAVGSTFRAWSGPCTPVVGQPNQCNTANMSTDRTVVAIFESASIGGTGDTFALTASGKLLSFYRSSPGTLQSNTSVTGLMSGDSLIAMDFRPSNGILYALARTATGKGHLYVVNEGTAEATQIAALNVEDNTFGTGNYEMAFTPASGETIFVSTPSGTLFQINPSTGATTSGAAPAGLSSLAFTNAFKGERFTTTYGINSTSNQLVKVSLTTPATAPAVGVLAADAPDANGFVIDAQNGRAMVAFSSSGPKLYTVDLSSGVLSSSQAIGDGAVAAESVIALAIPPPGEPQFFAICQGKVNSRSTTTCNDGKTLLRFQASNPGALSVVGDVTGLAADELIVAMDVRPSTNDIYALSTASKLYTIDPITAAATLKATVTPAIDAANLILGFDFNPITEKIRVIGGVADRIEGDSVDVEVDPTTGVATSLGLAQQLPFKIANVAFSGNVPGGDDATLWYGIDSQNNRLFTIDPETTSSPFTSPGQLTFVTQLGFDPTERGGFEIIGDGAAYVVRSSSTNGASLYSLNLTTGAATLIGSIGTLSGFSGEVTGLTAQVQLSNADLREFVVATTVAAPAAELLTFDAGNPAATNDPPTPQVLTSRRTLAGLLPGETVLGLEYRYEGSSNKLYLLARSTTNTARLYTVDVATGVASTAGLTGDVMTDPATKYALIGTEFGMDVDPATNNLRVVSDKGENLSIDPMLATAQVIEDMDDTPHPAMNAAAFSHNYAGTLSSTLYVYDAAPSDDALMTIDAGQFLRRMSGSGLANGTSDEVSFDILGGHDGLAVATEVFCDDSDPICSLGAFTELYQMDLATGAASDINSVGSGPIPGETRVQIRAMTIRFPN
ncbi:MAG TPA: DUF4394 domain-containing protein [Candidatus Binatia bacterium]|nr:DUF4394 domain-containing protein [Candidatus Binatia bacterium]